MFWLLLVIALCLLAPQIPVWVFRSLPRRPPPPVSEGELGHLAALARPPAPGLAAKPASPADITTTPGPIAEPKTSVKGGQAAVPLKLRSYGCLNALLGVATIVGFLALGAGWAALFHYLGELRARGFPPSAFLIKPGIYGLLFAVPCLFLGIFTSIVPVQLLARLVLGRRYVEYLYHEEGRIAWQGRDPDALVRFLGRLGLFVGVGCAIYAVLVLNWYARFTDDAVAIKRLFALTEEVHPYSQVEQFIVTSHRDTNQGIVEEEDLHLRFADGKTWSTDQTFFLPRDPDERARLLDFVQRKIGRPPQRARFIEDVPGW